MGIYIDETLNWSASISLFQYLVQNITPPPTFPVYSSARAKLFYQSYIMPLIDYGSEVWGSAPADQSVALKYGWMWIRFLNLHLVKL